MSGPSGDGPGENDVPLVIEPDVDPLTTEDLNFYTGTPVFFIQRMPVSKVVNQVTIGDIGKGSDCTRDVSIKLGIIESRTGNWKDGRWVAGSGPVPLPSTPQRMTFGFSQPVTLVGGRAYELVVSHGASYCVTGKRTSWAHNEPTVNPGPGACDQMVQFRGSTDQRFWHVRGEDDLPDPALCQGGQAPTGFDRTLPTGWMLVRTYVWPYVYVDDVYEGGSPADCGAMIPGYGVQATYWLTEPGPPPKDRYLCQWSQFADFGSEVPDGWYYGGPWSPDARNGAPRDMYLRLDTIDYDALLRLHVPLLKFDSQETYFADSARTITDNVYDPLGNGVLKSGNYLKAESGAIIAASDASLPFADLSLDFLGDPQYFDGTAAAETDFLDEADTYESDAQRLHADPRYADRVYGRATHDSTGKLWLQYWFFYYYNPQNLGFLNTGEHEGDWEMIQVGLKPDLTPDVTTYARHADNETGRCPWSAVHKAPSAPDSPVVYVANGSHAAYFAPGDYDRGPASTLPTDEADGLGREVAPALEIIRDDAPRWVAWRGRWGASGNNSPPGLPEQGNRWSAPDVFHEGGKDCTVGPLGQAVYPSARGDGRTLRAASVRIRPRPLPPRISARRRGNKALVRYRFRTLPPKQSRRPTTVFVTIHPKERRLAPSGRSVRVRRRSGRLTMPLPLGRGPYTARASASRRDGLRSRVVYVRIR